MNHLLTTILCSTLAFAPNSMQAKEKEPHHTSNQITIDNIVNGKYNGQRIHGVRPASSGDTYTQMSADRKRIIRRSFKTGKDIETLFDAEQARGPLQLKSIDNYILSPDGRRILLQTNTKPIYRRSFTATYYIYDIPNQSFEPLSDGGPQQVPIFSPDGSMIAFARNNNLFLVKLFFGNAESQITTDGKFNEVLNGIPDWVNEEEFSTNRSFCFTADSRMIAWVRYDESKVPTYPIQMFKGAAPTITANDAYPGDYVYKYPVAGELNSSVSVKSYNIKSHKTLTLNVPLDADGYIPRIYPTNDANKLAVVTLNRHQDQMDIYMVNPRTTLAQLALRETAKCYVKETAYERLTFYPNQFVISSGRNGYQNLYLYSLTGELIRPLTSGKQDVTAFYGYNPKTGECYYQSIDKTPIRRAVYKTNRKGAVTRLSQKEGTNDAIFSSDFRYFMNVYSNATTPYITTLCRADGQPTSTLLSNEKIEKEVAQFGSKKEFFSFTTADNIKLNGWMIKPKDFDPNKKYPVLMFQYSGPGSQQVRDQWAIGFYPGAVYETYLNQHDYIVACVDGRGTGARGDAFEKCTYLQLGKLEAIDQVQTAKYLGSLPYIDAQRIGIWGWSFGGFNTLMSMSEPDHVFKAGIAVAAPTNWKFYDTVYTERYMRTPQENAFYQDNPISRANHLAGHLLLIHGSADDNVHYRNCAEYTEALVQANKQFDMQIYTNRNHSIYGGNTRRHLFNRMTNFIFNNL